MNNVSSDNDSSLEQKLKSDASMFEAELSDVSKQRLFSRLESELTQKRSDVTPNLVVEDNKNTRNFNSTRFLALVASVFVVLSLGVIVYKGSNTEQELIPEVATTQANSSNSSVVEKFVASHKNAETGFESNLVASKQLNNELNLIKSDIDKLAKKIASL